MAEAEPDLAPLVHELPLELASVEVDIASGSCVGENRAVEKKAVKSRGKPAATMRILMAKENEARDKEKRTKMIEKMPESTRITRQHVEEESRKQKKSCEIVSEKQDTESASKAPTNEASVKQKAASDREERINRRVDQVLQGRKQTRVSTGAGRNGARKTGSCFNHFIRERNKMFTNLLACGSSSAEAEVEDPDSDAPFVFSRGNVSMTVESPAEQWDESDRAVAEVVAELHAAAQRRLQNSVASELCVETEESLRQPARGEESSVHFRESTGQKEPLVGMHSASEEDNCSTLLGANEEAGGAHKENDFQPQQDDRSVSLDLLPESETQRRKDPARTEENQTKQGTKTEIENTASETLLTAAESAVHEESHDVSEAVEARKEVLKENESVRLKNMSGTRTEREGPSNNVLHKVQQEVQEKDSLKTNDQQVATHFTARALDHDEEGKSRQTRVQHRLGTGRNGPRNERVRWTSSSLFSLRKVLFSTNCVAAHRKKLRGKPKKHKSAQQKKQRARTSEKRCEEANVRETRRRDTGRQKTRQESNTEMLKKLRNVTCGARPATIDASPETIQRGHLNATQAPEVKLVTRIEGRRLSAEKERYDSVQSVNTSACRRGKAHFRKGTGRNGSRNPRTASEQITRFAKKRLLFSSLCAEFHRRILRFRKRKSEIRIERLKNAEDTEMRRTTRSVGAKNRLSPGKDMTQFWTETRGSESNAADSERSEMAEEFETVRGTWVSPSVDETQMKRITRSAGITTAAAPNRDGKLRTRKAAPQDVNLEESRSQDPAFQPQSGATEDKLPESFTNVDEIASRTARKSDSGSEVATHVSLTEIIGGSRPDPCGKLEPTGRDGRERQAQSLALPTRGAETEPTQTTKSSERQGKCGEPAVEPKVAVRVRPGPGPVRLSGRGRSGVSSKRLKQGNDLRVFTERRRLFTTFCAAHRLRQQQRARDRKTVQTSSRMTRSRSLNRTAVAEKPTKDSGEISANEESNTSAAGKQTEAVVPKVSMAVEPNLQTSKVMVEVPEEVRTAAEDSPEASGVLPISASGTAGLVRNVLMCEKIGAANGDSPSDSVAAAVHALVKPEMKETAGPTGRGRSGARNTRLRPREARRFVQRRLLFSTLCAVQKLRMRLRKQSASEKRSRSEAPRRVLRSTTTTVQLAQGDISQNSVRLAPWTRFAVRRQNSSQGTGRRGTRNERLRSQTPRSFVFRRRLFSTLCTVHQLRRQLRQKARFEKRFEEEARRKKPNTGTRTRSRVTTRSTCDGTERHAALPSEGERTTSTMVPKSRCDGTSEQQLLLRGTERKKMSTDRKVNQTKRQKAGDTEAGRQSTAEVQDPAAPNSKDECGDESPPEAPSTHQKSKENLEGRSAQRTTRQVNSSNHSQLPGVDLTLSQKDKKHCKILGNQQESLFRERGRNASESTDAKKPALKPGCGKLDACIVRLHHLAAAKLPGPISASGNTQNVDKRESAEPSVDTAKKNAAQEINQSTTEANGNGPTVQRGRRESDREPETSDEQAQGHLCVGAACAPGPKPQDSTLPRAENAEFVSKPSGNENGQSLAVATEERQPCKRAQFVCDGNICEQVETINAAGRNRRDSPSTSAERRSTQSGVMRNLITVVAQVHHNHDPEDNEEVEEAASSAEADIGDSRRDVVGFPPANQEGRNAVLELRRRLMTVVAQVHRNHEPEQVKPTSPIEEKREIAPDINSVVSESNYCSATEELSPRSSQVSCFEFSW